VPQEFPALKRGDVQFLQDSGKLTDALIRCISSGESTSTAFMPTHAALSQVEASFTPNATK
jgi:hypothetical protein